MQGLEVMAIHVGRYFTTGVKQALKTLELIKPELAIPMHYNTWPLIQGNEHDKNQKLCILVMYKYFL